MRGRSKVATIIFLIFVALRVSRGCYYEQQRVQREAEIRETINERFMERFNLNPTKEATSP